MKVVFFFTEMSRLFLKKISFTLKRRVFLLKGRAFFFKLTYPAKAGFHDSKVIDRQKKRHCGNFSSA
jgi:hypothetical protein